MSGPKTIVVGAGVAGIAMGHTLKWKLGYSNFEVCHIAIASHKANWSDIRETRRSWRNMESKYLSRLVCSKPLSNVLSNC
jgi:hypothetical protein